MQLRETVSSADQHQLLQRLEPIFGQQGYRIVELSCAALRRSTHLRIVLFHPQGISLDACAELHKIADVQIVRLQREEGLYPDYSLELSSPGLGRQLRCEREFVVFCGQGVRCLVQEQWFAGTLAGLEKTAEGEWQLHVKAPAAEANDLAAKTARAAEEGAAEAGAAWAFRLEQVAKVVLDSQQIAARSASAEN